MALIPRPAVTAIAVLVIAVWALSQVAVVFVDGYEAPPEIHLVVMVVLGALFAVRKDDKPDERKPDEPAQLEPPPDPERPPGGVSAADLIARLQAERRPPER